MSAPVLLAPSGWFLCTFLLLATVYDVKYRILPNSLIVAAIGWGVLGHTLGWWVWHGWWMLGVAVPFLVATIPMGDVKGIMVLGGILGADAVMIVCGALLILLLLFTGYWCRWWPYPGNQPFFLYITGLTCGTVLAGWIWPI